MTFCFKREFPLIFFSSGMQFNFFFSLNKLVSGWPYNDAKFTQCVFTLLFLKQNSFN